MPEYAHTVDSERATSFETSQGDVDVVLARGDIPSDVASLRDELDGLGPLNPDEESDRERVVTSFLKYRMEMASPPIREVADV